MSLANFSVLTFDCYGTLIDWESGMVAGLRPLTEAVGGLSRDDILEAHARFESTQQAQTPAMRYCDLLAVVYKRLAEYWGVPASRDACLAYGRSVRDWPAFPDTQDALTRLAKHARLVILSNVDNKSFEGSRERLGAPLDAVYTAEDVGSYKPSDRNFSYMIENLRARGIEPSSILHVAESLFHDHEPANRFELANCWIHRRYEAGGFGATMAPSNEPRTTYKYNSMAELADAFDAGD